MNTNFISGLIGAVLVIGSVSAQAMPANDPTLTHYPAANVLAHRGNFAADFVQGRLVSTDARGAAPASATLDGDRAARYAAQSNVVTLALLGVVGMVVAGLVLLGNIRRGANRRESAPGDGWKGTLFDMLEADLINLDSLTHGFSGR